jgi:hypothetical protein
MENIDLIVTWPTNCDYPLWRGKLRLERALYKKVIVIFMNPNQGDNYRDFIVDDLGGHFVTFIDSPEVAPGEDWRNVAVNAGLEASDCKWVWFTEQDFFVINHDRFWPKVRDARQFNNVVGLREAASGRMHPACLFVRRNLIDKSTKNFAVTEDGDHFARFTKEVTRNPQWTSLALLGLTAKQGALDPAEHDWVHMNGLSHNHTLIHDENYAGVYKPDEMEKYLQQCLDMEKQGLAFHPRWKKEAKAFLEFRQAAK